MIKESVYKFDPDRALDEIKEDYLKAYRKPMTRLEELFYDLFFAAVKKEGMDLDEAKEFWDIISSCTWRPLQVRELGEPTKKDSPLVNLAKCTDLLARRKLSDMLGGYCGPRMKDDIKEILERAVMEASSKSNSPVKSCYVCVNTRFREGAIEWLLEDDPKKVGDLEIEGWETEFVIC